jgi:hypothetical protein
VGKHITRQWAVASDPLGVRDTELLPPCFRTSIQEDAMRAYLAKLPPKAQMLLAIPLIAVAYPVVMILLPAIIRAIVPEVVRSVLSLL